MSAVPKELTIHPITGKPICGALRNGMKQRLEEEGLTIEDIVKNPSLITTYCCCSAPFKQAYDNGRCRIHGGKAGRPIEHGRYSKYLPTLTQEELGKISLDGHKGLEQELSILVKYIQHKLPTSMGEFATAANARLRKSINKLRNAVESLNIQRMRSIMDDIESQIDDNLTVEAAKRDVRQLIKEYSDVFKVEIQKRALSGEYFSKVEVVNSYRVFFTVVRKHVLEKTVSDEIKKEFISILNRGAGIGLPTGSEIISSDAIGLEDQDEG